MYFCNVNQNNYNGNKRKRLRKQVIILIESMNLYLTMQDTIKSGTIDLDQIWKTIDLLDMNIKNVNLCYVSYYWDNLY